MILKSLVTFVSSSIPCTLAPVFPLLGGAQQTPRQPRSRGSFPRPLEILLLHAECLGHVLAPQRVPALLVILPPHPEGAEAARLARLGAEAGGAPQVEQRRRVQVMSEEVTRSRLYGCLCTSEAYLILGFNFLTAHTLQNLPQLKCLLFEQRRYLRPELSASVIG